MVIVDDLVQTGGTLLECAKVYTNLLYTHMYMYMYKSCMYLPYLDYIANLDCNPHPAILDVGYIVLWTMNTTMYIYHNGVNAPHVNKSIIIILSI